MKISIADKNSDAGALVRLFVSNLTPDYISHSELQGHRALRPEEWATDIDRQTLDEIRGRLAAPLADFPDGDWQGVIEAHDNENLVGVALVTISRDAAVPFGIIEDIVVDNSRRGAGLGKEMMEWILASLRKAGVRRAFLESGVGNEGAHHLFERLGFNTISIVMMKEL